MLCFVCILKLLLLLLLLLFKIKNYTLCRAMVIKSDEMALFLWGELWVNLQPDSWALDLSVSSLQSFLSLQIVCSFPCLMRASLCCFRSKHSKVSRLWSWWKCQYFFLDLLFGSPFSLYSHISAGSSLIYVRTWSSGVKLAILPSGGFDLLSSLQSFVWTDFLPLSGRGSSCFSLFFGLPPWCGHNGW